MQPDHVRMILVAHHINAMQYVALTDDCQALLKVGSFLLLTFISRQPIEQAEELPVAII